MKHVSLEIVRATEAAAIAASKWIGSGNKELADKDATDAMRDRLNKIDFRAKSILCEGKKDKSFGFEDFEIFGLANYGQIYDLAVDPIEGTTPTVTSGPEAISTMAIAEQDSLIRLDCFYVNKLAYSKSIKDKVKLNINDAIEATCNKISKATNKPLSQIMVCVLNRPRHQKIIDRLRVVGVRIKLIQDCDVSGAIATCLPDSGIDLLYGIGGAPEAVISAAAIKCLGGDFQIKIVDESNNWDEKGDVLEINDLVKGSCAFIASGITNGSILKGVRFTERGPITNSVFMRSESQTIRWLTTEHGN